jgi:hypothetical protein
LTEKGRESDGKKGGKKGERGKKSDEKKDGQYASIRSRQGYLNSTKKRA